MLRRPHRYDAVGMTWWDPPDAKEKNPDKEVLRKACATMAGADFARRFHFRFVRPMSTWGGSYTMVTRPGETDSVDVPEWLDRAWRPLYWLRRRWDGLRYGLDRDSR